MVDSIGQKIQNGTTAGQAGNKTSVQVSQDSKEGVEKLQQGLSERIKNLGDRIYGANRNLQNTQKEYDDCGFWARVSGLTSTLEKQLENEAKYRDQLISQKDQLLETQTRVQELIKKGDYGLAKAVLEGKEQEYKENMLKAGKQAIQGYQKINEKIGEADKFLARTETTLKVAQKGTVIAGAIVATAATGGAGAGLLVTAVAGTGAGAGIGALTNFTEASGHIAYENKTAGGALTDALKQTGDDALTGAQIGLSGGMAGLLGRGISSVRSIQSMSTLSRTLITGSGAGGTSGLTGSVLQTGTNIALGREQRTGGEILRDTLMQTSVGMISGGLGAKGQHALDKTISQGGVNSLSRTLFIKGTTEVAAPTALSLGSHVLVHGELPSIEQGTQEVALAILGSHVGARVSSNHKSGRTIKQELAEMPTFGATVGSVRRLFKKQVPPPAAAGTKGTQVVQRRHHDEATMEYIAEKKKGNNINSVYWSNLENPNLARVKTFKVGDETCHIIWLKSDVLPSHTPIEAGSLLRKYLTSKPGSREHAAFQECEKLLVDAFCKSRKNFSKDIKTTNGFVIQGHDWFGMEAGTSLGIRVNGKYHVEPLLKALGSGNARKVKQILESIKAEFSHENTHYVRFSNDLEGLSFAANPKNEIAEHTIQFLHSPRRNLRFVKQLHDAIRNPNQNYYNQAQVGSLKVLYKKLSGDRACKYKPKNYTPNQLRRAIESIPPSEREITIQRISREIIFETSENLMDLANSVPDINLAVGQVGVRTPKEIKSLDYETATKRGTIKHDREMLIAIIEGDDFYNLDSVIAGRELAEQSGVNDYNNALAGRIIKEIKNGRLKPKDIATLADKLGDKELTKKVWEGLSVKESNGATGAGDSKRPSLTRDQATDHLYGISCKPPPGTGEKFKSIGTTRDGMNGQVYQIVTPENHPVWKGRTILVSFDMGSGNTNGNGQLQTHNGGTWKFIHRDGDGSFYRDKTFVLDKDLNIIKVNKPGESEK